MARTVESALQFEYSHTVTPLAYFLIGLAFVLGLGVALFLVRQAKTQMSEHFKSLSLDILQSNSKTFVEIAKGELEKAQLSVTGELAQRHEAIKTLVEPLKQQLETYQTRLQQSETVQASTLGELKKQLETLALQSQSLADETQQFRMVLNSSQARGRWGEETLRRVVEAAGMSAHCDFTEQMVAGDAKPDLIVRLPRDRVIIVDAKVPDLDFLSALQTADARKRADLLAAHARKLKDTIKSLADRDYPKQFPNAFDHVVLFVPAESLFSAALEGDHDLIVWATSKRIMLATPASLIALLRSVSLFWQQHAQTENTLAIAEAAQDLYARVTTFTEHFENIRDGLEKAGEAFNKSVGSYERMVRPAGEKIQKLRAAVGEKELADVRPLDSTLRLAPSSTSPEIKPEHAQNLSGISRARQ
ncbi:MAG: DNA recombination protein RmuC [Verrucomicrobia bacterium]|nr:MAG: DNA recombination protein RmuC [Verrucomicrobiota bacterium]